MLILLFFLTALVYGSVGFGGGSTYLALLLVWGTPYERVPEVALLCNLIVVTGGVFHFARAGQLPWMRLLFFVLTSIPMAYWGGTLSITRDLFMMLASVSLAVAGLRLLAVERPPRSSLRHRSAARWPLELLAGAGIGFVSGLIGIGGGIFLSPVLYFMGSGTAREIAGLSSLFILLNSVSGLLGHFTKATGVVDLLELSPLVLATFLGGQLGSRIGVGKLPLSGIQRTTGILISAAALRMAWQLL